MAIDMKSIFADLEKELLEPMPAELPAEKPKFEITDPETAGWVVGKLLALDDKEQIVKDQYKAMLKDIENDRRHLHWRFEDELRFWAKANLPKKGKSIKLLTGTVAFRSVSETLTIVDDDMAIAWAEKHCPWAVKVKKTVSKKALLEYYKKTGDLGDGCRVDEPYESFSVTKSK